VADFTGTGKTGAGRAITAFALADAGFAAFDIAEANFSGAGVGAGVSLGAEVARVASGVFG